MKFTPEELTSLIKASYEAENVNISRFIIDDSLSTNRMKVYNTDKDNEGKMVIVVHRGSAEVQDWIDNLKAFVNIDIKSTDTYKIHRDLQLTVVDKYGANKIVCIGHSRSTLYLNEFMKIPRLCKEIINYNMPISFYDTLIGTVKMPVKEIKDNTTNIRSENDLPSIGQTISINEPDITIPSKPGNNILDEHSPDNLLNLDNKQLIGKGKKPIKITTLKPTVQFVKKINYGELRVKDMRQFIKENKHRILDRKINITGLTKKQMIPIIEELNNLP
jgi:hypothetical protein